MKINNNSYNITIPYSALNSSIQNSRRKAKPIFQEEKEFIESHLPEIAPLPNDCWITGGSTKYIYLDLYHDDYYIKFKCENGGKFVLLKDNRRLFENYIQITIQQTLDKEKERCENLYNQALKRLTNYVNTNLNKKYSISISGGKDSEVALSLWNDMLKSNLLDFIPDYKIMFFNTSNEVADVYKRIKSINNVEIINPEIGWRQWIKNNQYSFPNVFRRSCCSTYKEGQVKKIFNKEDEVVQVLGVRKTESNTRSKYEFCMDYDFAVNLFGFSNMPKKWIKLAPIVEFETIDVWLIMLMKNIYINRKYRIGNNRVGCLICPYSNAYEDELIKIYYNHQYQWFVKAITENYKISHASLLGHSLKEWIDGAWKSPTSKNYELLRRIPNEKNIHVYAELKGLSDEMAKKFFNRKCEVCNKIVAEKDIALFYKMFGRMEKQQDDRNVFCKKHLIEKLNVTQQEYLDMIQDFINSGCNLF